jgi:histidine triad (HIT) family protein
MASIFSRIVSGEIPCNEIASTDDFMAFLDISPLAEGHTLVIPKVEVDHILDVQPDVAAGLMVFAQKVGKAIHQVSGKARMGMVVAGFEVPHAHIHLIPINDEEELNFNQPRIGMTDGQFKQMAERIREAYQKL